VARGRTVFISEQHPFTRAPMYRMRESEDCRPAERRIPRSFQEWVELAAEDRIPAEVKRAILERNPELMRLAGGREDVDGAVVVAFLLGSLDYLWLKGHSLEVNFFDATKVLAAARDRTGSAPYPDLPSMVEAYGNLMYSAGVADAALGFSLTRSGGAVDVAKENSVVAKLRKRRAILAMAEAVGDQLVWEICRAAKSKYWSPPSLVFKLPRTPRWGDNIAESPSDAVSGWWFAGQLADSLRAFAEWARREAQDPEGSVRLVGYLDGLVGKWIRGRTRATVDLEPVRRVLIASRIRQLELPRPDLPSLLRAYGALMRAKGVVDTTIRSWAWRDRAKRFMLDAVIDALERELVKEIWSGANRVWSRPSIQY